MARTTKRHDHCQCFEQQNWRKIFPFKSRPLPLPHNERAKLFVIISVNHFPFTAVLNGELVFSPSTWSGTFARRSVRPKSTKRLFDSPKWSSTRISSPEAKELREELPPHSPNAKLIKLSFAFPFSISMWSDEDLLKSRLFVYQFMYLIDAGAPIIVNIALRAALFQSWTSKTLWNLGKRRTIPNNRRNERHLDEYLFPNQPLSYLFSFTRFGTRVRHLSNQRSSKMILVLKQSCSGRKAWDSLLSNSIHAVQWTVAFSTSFSSLDLSV